MNMKSGRSRRTFGSYWIEGLPETALFNQLLGLTAGAVLIIYGNVDQSPGRTVLGGLLFANGIGFLIKFFGAAVFALFGKFLPPKKYVSVLLWIPPIALGTFLGSELAMEANRRLFGAFFPGLRSHYHLRLLLSNGLIVATFALVIFAYVILRNRLSREIAENRRISFLENRARLIALQSKIKPHFLFNTLNTILDLARENPGVLEKVVLNLSGIYRRILRDSGEGVFPLKEELDLIRKYLEIEKVRMGERLRFRIDVAGDADEVRIPPMLVEPLVENAVIHGIGPRPSGGYVDIQVRRGNGKVIIVVRDDGVGFSGAGEKDGFGLSSVKERLDLVYRGKASFSVTAPESGGLTVEMEIPDESAYFYR
jgi:two-component system LytT family sensor kinase